MLSLDQPSTLSLKHPEGRKIDLLLTIFPNLKYLPIVGVCLYLSSSRIQMKERKRYHSLYFFPLLDSRKDYFAHYL